MVEKTAQAGTFLPVDSYFARKSWRFKLETRILHSNVQKTLVFSNAEAVEISVAESAVYENARERVLETAPA